MTYEFTLPMRAFSVNAYRYRNNINKTKEARAYEAEFLQKLEMHRAPLMSLAAHWRSVRGTIKVTYVCIYPRDFYLNAKGEVSARTYDCTNFEKPIQDLVFGFLGINDCFAKPLYSDKIPGDDFGIYVKLELGPLVPT